MKTSAIDRLRKAEQSPAWNRAGAYAIMRGAEYVGKILVKHPVDGMGPLEVFLWDWSDSNKPHEIQRGTASGCGYDKLAAALHGLTFAGITFDDHPHHWELSLKDAGFVVINVL